MKQRNSLKRKKGSKESVNYFNKDTENAIIEFQQEENLELKKKIFVEKIRLPFLKLIENIIYVYKFHTLGEIDILKNDCLSFLFESLYKFDKSRQTQAFSYYNVCCKHWFIQRVKNYKKKSKSDVCFDKPLITKLEQTNNNFVDNLEEDLENIEFMMLLKEEMKKWRHKFDKTQEKLVLEAIILLFENPDLVSVYNKKGINVYLREITNLKNTKQIVTNLKKFKKKYNLFKKNYYG
jgi:hypothetical protein